MKSLLTFNAFSNKSKYALSCLTNKCETNYLSFESIFLEFPSNLLFARLSNIKRVDVTIEINNSILFNFCIKLKRVRQNLILVRKLNVA
ncbi:hypothetical protein BpHYR1_006609 [Brachionus plicatilis]|uniref:Uncharacterized protein n=1 Tax=Brachionus plicatilis TaxID=10195 RepID=A0A3M7PQU8_BRAPC|nr:hypothetical protein BpHYR1_006609 [Brachionus plicatilis]